jgi:hypothetical protein
MRNKRRLLSKSRRYPRLKLNSRQNRLSKFLNKLLIKKKKKFLWLKRKLKNKDLDFKAIIYLQLP